ncbi:MAG: MBL fold metallo-hydrolase [Nitrososphaerota archaeon]
MRLTFLGTGSIVPTPDRFSSAILLEIGKGKLLLDCGPGTLEKLRRVSVDPNAISRVFLTHYHVDHVLDLPAMVKLRVFDSSGGPSPSPLRLKVYGPAGLITLARYLFEEIPQFRYISKNLSCLKYLELKEVEEGLVEETDTWRVTCTPVKHYDGVAYRIEAEGKSIVYSGDTVPDENLIELAKGADILIHECSFPDEYLLGLHTSEKGLAELAARIRPRILIPAHLYPIWEGREEELKTILVNAFGGKVIVPKDFESYEV